MNKTINIGLAGYSFHIDEMAYMKLSDYLKALRSSLNANEADEIMHDIELRIVEILKDTLGKREVVNQNDIEHMITQIGTPEQIDNQDNYQENSDAKKSVQENKENQKQLFLDPENKAIAGLCSGLAHYLNIDTVWVRLAFLVLVSFNGFGLLLYFILWIIVPTAKTTTDFLKMKGQNPNFENIKNHTANNVSVFANEANKKLSQFYQENKHIASNTGSFIAKLIKGIIGSLFLLLTLALIIACFAITFNVDNNDVLSNFEFYFGDNQLGSMGFVFAIITLIIPAVILCVIGIKLLFSKSNLRFTGYIIGGLVVIWFVLISLLGATFTKYVKNYSGDKEEIENLNLETTPTETLYIGLQKVSIPKNFKPYWDDVFSDGKKIYKEDYPYIKITHKDVSQAFLMIKKQAEAYNIPLQIEVPLRLDGNNLYLPNYFGYDYKDRFRDVNVQYELVVPENVNVKELNENQINLDDDTTEEHHKNRSQNKPKIIVNGKEVSAPNFDKQLKISDDSIKEFNIKLNKDYSPEINIRTR